MKRLLASIAVATMLAAPVSAQPVDRAAVVAFCLTSTPAQCADFLASYLASLPPAARLAAYNAIVAELSASGVTVTLPAPPAVSTPGANDLNAGVGSGEPVNPSPN